MATAILPAQSPDSQLDSPNDGFWDITIGLPCEYSIPVHVPEETFLSLDSFAKANGVLISELCQALVCRFAGQLKGGA